jgi:hypothetical protein
MKTASRPTIRKAALLAFAATAGLAAHPVSAQDSVSSFKLPPGPTSTPEPQGPVTEGVPRPRAAQPAPVRPAPAPTPTPAPLPTIEPPAVVIPAPTPTASATSARTVTAPRLPVPSPSASTAPPTAEPLPGPSASPAPLPIETASPAPAAPPILQLPAPEGSEEAPNRFAWWPWLAALVLLGAAAAGAWAVFTRRHRGAERPLVVPEIERPRVPANSLTASRLAAASGLVPPTPAKAATPPASEDDGLSLALEARQLSLTLTSAALAYRVTLTNNGKQRVSGITVAGDMISAHSSFSQDEQLANDASELAPRHEIESIAAGETTQVTGEFRLPFTLIRPIRKGKAVMFVPLARLRVKAADGGNGAVLLTALVGQRSREPGAGLQPFRLDLGPRIYREVTQRIFS